MEQYKELCHDFHLKVSRIIMSCSGDQVLQVARTYCTDS